jgi:hypothetical protein
MPIYEGQVSRQYGQRKRTTTLARTSEPSTSCTWATVSSSEGLVRPKFTVAVAPFSGAVAASPRDIAAAKWVVKMPAVGSCGCEVYKNQISKSKDVWRMGKFEVGHYVPSSIARRAGRISEPIPSDLSTVGAGGKSCPVCG